MSDSEGRDFNGFHPDPIEQLRRWLDEASGSPQWDAMALATADTEGQPSVRMVLFKGIVEGGIVFFTNYESRKGRELSENPRAAAVFYWEPLHRQVRLEGRVERLSDDASDAYWAGRPFESQLSAAASPQSQVIPSRAFLEERVADLREDHEEQKLPRPEHWGGLRLVPHRIEFWQGQPHRLHDRLCYERVGDGWIRERLAP